MAVLLLPPPALEFLHPRGPYMHPEEAMVQALSGTTPPITPAGTAKRWGTFRHLG